MEASKKFPPEIAAWLDAVRRTAAPNGTFGMKEDMPRATGSCVAMLLRAGQDIPAAERATIIKALQETQRADGAYGRAESKTSDLETTYRIMRAYHLLKAKPKDTTALRTFIAQCRNNDGGYGVEPGKPSAVNSTYYAAIILHWLRDKE
jgi:hypothetical protein